LLVLFQAGCGRNAPQPDQNGGNTPNSNKNNTPPILQIPGGSSGPAVPMVRQPTPDERHDAALLEALSKMTDRKYEEALAALEEARKAKDTPQVRQEITRVQSLLAQRQTLEKALADIQTVFNDGRPEEAVKLINAALAQFGDHPDVGKLLLLKRQADALLATGISDQAARRARFVQEAEAALKENNLRAAVLSYDQALAAGEDPTLKQKAEEIRGRLTKYDDCLTKATQLRREPLQWEDALAQYQAALAAWETAEVQQRIAEMQLALQKRKPRLGVADFELRGEAGVPMFGKIVSEELLGGFKLKYDLVERSQLNQVVEELKLQSSDLIANADGRKEVGKLAKLQYLVVGSVAPISGITVSARLIDVRTGLVAQTGKISAPTAEEAVKLLPQLAQILMMSDEEKAAYEKQLAEQAAAPPPVPPQDTLPPPPVVQDNQPPPQPIVTTTNRPPAVGNVQPQDFDRLPPMPLQGQPPVVQQQPPEVIVVQEQPVRRSMLAIQLELGDNLFRRGRYAEAQFHFALARDIAPTETAVLVRLDNVRPYLPPPATVVVIQPPPPPRERIAVLNFIYSGDPTVVPPYLATWTPDQLAPYFCPPFDVVDRTELYWYMSRMGLTVADVMNNPGARRWLARALRVRYFIFGTIQQTNSFNVTTHMVDAETGCLAGRGCVHARNPFELKCQLADLARNTLAPPQPTVVVIQQAQQRSQVTVDVHLALGKGDFELALSLSKRHRANNVNSMELAILEQQAEAARQAAILQTERERQWAKVEYEREKIAREQAKFAAEAARQAAILQEERARQGAKFAQEQAKRQQQVDLAFENLLTRARFAKANGNYPMALQYMESAAALKPFTHGGYQELAELRKAVDETNRRRVAEEAAARERLLRQQREAELARTRQNLERERQLRLAEEQQRLTSRERLDQAEYNRLLMQAKQLHAQGKLDAALASAQSARQLRKTDEVEALINAYSVDLARKQAEAKGDKERKELEQRLAQEKARREQAERLAAENQRKYEAALRLAQEAMTAKRYEVAVARYQDAAKVFRTDEAINGQKTAELALAESRRTQEEERKRTEAERQKATRLAMLKSQGQTHKANKRWQAALQAYEEALKLAPDDIAIRTEIEEIKVAEKAAIAARTPQQPLISPDRPQPSRPVQPSMPSVAEQQRKEAEAKRLQIAQLLFKARQAQQAQRFEEAEQAFDEVLKLEPANQTALQGKTAAAQGRQQAMEQQQFQKLMQDGKAALQANNPEAAIQAFDQAVKLRPNNPEAKTQLANAQRMQQQARMAAEKNERDKQAALQRQQQIADLVAKGQAAMQAKEYAQAENFFNEVLKLEPNNQAALQGKRNAFDAARTAQRPSDPGNTMAQNKARAQQLADVGKGAMKAKKYDEAIQAFEEALKLDPGNSDVQFQLGLAKQMKQQAAGTPGVPTRPDPKQQQVAQLIAQAKAHFQNKKYGMAIQAYQQVLQLDPNNQEARTGLAEVNKAVRDSQAGQNPQPPGGGSAATGEYNKQMQQAQALERQQRWAEAINAYKQALQSRPGDKQATSALKNAEFQMYMTRGKNLLRTGKKKEAADAFAAALERFPGHPEATKLYNQAKSGK
jgi:tetratricopeptide (TPR) repeat protein